MHQRSHGTCLTPMGFRTPVGADLEGALYHIKKVVIITAEATLKGNPNCHGSLELALAIKCPWMDIHAAWGKSFWGQLLLPTQFLPVAAELLLYPKRL